MDGVSPGPRFPRNWFSRRRAFAGCGARRRPEARLLVAPGKPGTPQKPRDFFLCVCVCVSWGERERPRGIKVQVRFSPTYTPSAQLVAHYSRRRQPGARCMDERFTFDEPSGASALVVIGAGMEKDKCQKYHGRFNSWGVATRTIMPGHFTNPSNPGELRSRLTCSPPLAVCARVARFGG